MDGDLVDMSGTLRLRPDGMFWDVETDCGEVISCVPSFWLKALGVASPESGGRIHFVARMKVVRSYEILEVV